MAALSAPEKAQALGIDALVMKPAMMQEWGVVMQRVLAQRAGQLPSRESAQTLGTASPKPVW